MYTGFHLSWDVRIRYQSPHLFWNLEVEVVTRCENNVVSEGEAVTEAAITDSVDSTQQSQSAYCLSDICFTLYKLQMELGASGTVNKLHIITVAWLCLRILTVTLVLCISWINDEGGYYIWCWHVVYIVGMSMIIHWRRFDYVTSRVSNRAWRILLGPYQGQYFL